MSGRAPVTWALWSARGEADQAGHADVVGIFPLDMFFASQGVDDRCLQSFGELHQLVMCALAAAAAEQRDAPGLVEEINSEVGNLQRFFI
jgi:hypothetical protein